MKTFFTIACISFISWFVIASCLDETDKAYAENPRLRPIPVITYGEMTVEYGPPAGDWTRVGDEFVYVIDVSGSMFPCEEGTDPSAAWRRWSCQ